jgi:hypothetical protein
VELIWWWMSSCCKELRLLLHLLLAYIKELKRENAVKLRFGV